MHQGLVETLKALLGKLQRLVALQVVSVNPNRQLVEVYLAVAWEAANYNLKAVSLDQVHHLEEEVLEQTLALNLSLVVKFNPSNLT